MKKYLSLILSMVIAFTCFGGFSAFAGAGNVFFVSPDGDDSNAGTEAEPLKTLQGANEKIKNIQGDVTVVFGGGKYTFDSTVNFDSSSKSNVTYTSKPGEKAVFTAGTAYSGFEECTVNGNIKAFKKNVGKDCSFNILFNDKTTLSRTRYPESGYLYVNSVDEKDNATPETEITSVHCGLNGFYADKNDIPELKNEKDVVVRVLHYWKDELLNIASYDKATGHMLFNKPSSMTFAKGDRYFMQNVFSTLNEPGEWYLDKSEGVLYYIPFEGEKADSLTLWGSETETLIKISGCSNITFDKIIFRGNGFNVPAQRDFSQAAYDAPSCVRVENSSGINFTNCEFRDIAACSVFYGSVVTDCVVDSCIFDNIGAQAVYIRGENVDYSSPRITKNFKVTNNIIRHYGRVFFNAVGVLVIHANSVDIMNNEISDGYYTAISVGWCWGYAYTNCYNNKVCDNLIYNIGQGWLSDMGGIYTLGNQHGTVLSGNVIHNVAADPGEGGYGGWGIYLDEGSSYILVEKNLVYSCGNDGYHLHYGSYNTVRNNIFALNGESQIRVVSAPKRCTPEDGNKKTADFVGNILLTKDGTCTFSHIENRETHTEQGNIMWDLTKGNDLYANVGGNLKKCLNILRAQNQGYIGEPKVFDPGFKDAEKFDFALNDDSAAVKAGFEKWDYGRAGTKAGTTVGIDTEGGQTAYNANSANVPLTKAKEPGHIFFVIWNKLVQWFRNVLSVKKHGGAVQC